MINESEHISQNILDLILECLLTENDEPEQYQFSISLLRETEERLGVSIGQIDELD